MMLNFTLLFPSLSLLLVSFFARGSVTSPNEDNNVGICPSILQILFLYRSPWSS